MFVTCMLMYQNYKYNVNTHLHYIKLLAALYTKSYQVILTQYMQEKGNTDGLKNIQALIIVISDWMFVVVVVAFN